MSQTQMLRRCPAAQRGEVEKVQTLCKCPLLRGRDNLNTTNHNDFDSENGKHNGSFLLRHVETHRSGNRTTLLHARITG